LKQRLLTSTILLAVVLAVFWLDARLETASLPQLLRGPLGGREHPPRGIALFVLALLIVPLAARELTAILRASGISARGWLTTVAGVVGLVLSYTVPGVAAAGTAPAARVAAALVATGLVAVSMTALYTFSRGHTVEGVGAGAGAALLATVYLGFMPGFLLAIRHTHSAWLVLGVIVLTKSADTGAYLTGRAAGRHQLIPWLSPGKTWEGLVGGIALAAATGLVLAWAGRSLLVEAERIPWWGGAACGVLFALVGQMGDLSVSLLKRGAGMKDSSSVLPGLGGLLDVLDSPLLVAPVAYWVLTLPWNG
jgi:phosphatidate cytidylyltransferase